MTNDMSTDDVSGVVVADINKPFQGCICTHFPTKPVVVETTELWEKKRQTKALQDWTENDFMCKDFISSVLSDDLYDYYNSDDVTAHKLWEALHKKYDTEEVGTKKWIKRVVGMLANKAYRSDPLVYARLVVRVRCVWLPGYTSALQIADVFGFAWFRLILLGYTSAIADVFGSAWFVLFCLVTRLLYRLQMRLVAWLHVCFTDCRCVWLFGYMSALQIADVFGYMFALQIAYVCVWLPGHMSALQIADVFGSSSALVCMHLFGLLRIETSSSIESAL
ncbi:hypothetical protein Tco_1072506 [Tanacetum coccineum]